MKKKILLISLIVALFAFVLAIGISAQTPSQYIEFKVKLTGGSDYITAYVKDIFPSDPMFDLKEPFYSDIDFTNEINKSEIAGIDLSDAVPVKSGKAYVVHFKNADPSVYPNCKEIKWFNTPGSTTIIGMIAFQNWKSLEYFDFGCATEIVDRAFMNCGLKELVFPKSIKTIKGGAFSGNASLETVVFEGGPTTVAGGIFTDCTSLRSVDLGQIEVISEGMFQRCTSLTSIEIPSSVKSIGKVAFENCKALTSVVINEGVTVVGASMFNNCTNLATVSLPSTITKIEGSAFSNCTSLTSITIPENVTEIGNTAFYKAGILSLHIPAKVTKLGYQVAEESKIVSLTFAKNSQLKFIDHRAFMNCKSLVGPVILPDGLEEIDYALFSGCTSLKAVKIPDSVTKYTEEKAMFTGCSSLEFVQLSKNVDVIPGSMFENCSSLKAISIPEGVTRISYKALRNCTSLQAIYLPSTLTTLGVTDSGTDKGAFYQSKKVYFVENEFDVFNGDELIGDSFVMPSRPDVYYMPSSLNFIGNSEFQNCAEINPVIVFPSSVTSAAGCAQGAFQSTGSSALPKTFVFLGDMVDLQIKQNDQSYSYISFVFANPNDVDLNSVSLIVGSSGTNREQKNTYMYFCAGNVAYDLSTFKAPNSTVYTVEEADFTKTVNTEETQPHFADVRKTVGVEPTCVDNRKEITFCFCGDAMGTVEKENTSLGHAHTIFEGLIYESFLNEGYYGYQCERCEDVNEDQKAPALFVCLGFSSSKIGNGISLGFKVNNEAVKTYESITGKVVKYGVFAVAQSKLGENDIFDESGKANENAIAAEITATEFVAFDIKIVGFATQEQKEALLALGAYVQTTKDGITEYSYMQDSKNQDGSKYSFISYNEILNK